MTFKMVEIVGWDIFKKIEQKCIKERFDSLHLILVSSNRDNGYRKSVYHAPFCGNVEVSAVNEFDIMRGLDGMMRYVKERQREIIYL